MKIGTAFVVIFIIFVVIVRVGGSDANEVKNLTTNIDRCEASVKDLLEINQQLNAELQQVSDANIRLSLENESLRNQPKNAEMDTLMGVGVTAVSAALLFLLTILGWVYLKRDQKPISIAHEESESRNFNRNHITITMDKRTYQEYVTYMRSKHTTRNT
jgi:predicted PurR-regulated permease PerM